MPPQVYLVLQRSPVFRQTKLRVLPRPRGSRNTAASHLCRGRGRRQKPQTKLHRGHRQSIRVPIQFPVRLPNKRNSKLSASNLNSSGPTTLPTVAILLCKLASWNRTSSGPEPRHHHQPTRASTLVADRHIPARSDGRSNNSSNSSNSNNHRSRPSILV